MYSVSVIIPSYNRPQLLKQAVDSVRMQNYPEKEIIVVDDGGLSTASWTAEDSQGVRLFEQEHKGCPAALNKGIQMATGDLICVLGDDDLLYDEYSLKHRAEAFTGDVEVVYTHAQEVDGNLNPMGVCKALPVDKDLIWKRDYINIHTMMWDKGIHSKIGYFEEDMISNEDWEFKIKCLMECNVKPLGFFSVKYRRHNGMKSMINHRNGIMDKCQLIFMERLRKRYANN